MLADLDRMAGEIEGYAAQIEGARDKYTVGTDDIEIDESPILSVADDGVWVSAWVWLPLEDDEEGDGGESD